MKKFRTIILVLPVLMVMSLICVVQAAVAGVEAECRQEAEDFEVVPELRDDYISGCIDSRGGVSTSTGAVEDYVPPSEPDDMINLDAGSENTAE
jgi:hypothetical protein